MSDDVMDEDYEGSEQEYNDTPVVATTRSAVKAQEAFATEWNKTKAKIWYTQNEDGTRKFCIKARKTAFVKNLIHLDGHPFSFEGREYLEPIYDRNDSEILMKNARQTEKCNLFSTLVTMADGSVKKAGELISGDKVISFNNRLLPEVDIVEGTVDNGTRKVYKVVTKKGRSVTVTDNHPFMKLLGWVPTSELKVGDFIGLPHKAGVFGSKHCPDLAKLYGYLIAEGSFSGREIRFHQDENLAMRDFVNTCDKLNQGYFTCKPTKGSSYVSLHRTSEIFDDLWGFFENKNSSDHRVPDWIWGSDEASTREFIRAMWAGDGYCKNTKPTLIEISYCSISEGLIQDLQNLLLKFGIFSSYRDNKPTLYKGTDKEAYILRVLGNKSIKRFHEVIGPILEKPFSVDSIVGKDQSDIIPDDVRDLIAEIVNSDKKFRRHGNNLQSVGLRKTPEYNLTKTKFLKYCEFLDHEKLWDIYNSEVYWDRVLSIDYVGEEPTIGIQIKNNHNHITDGIITHNSTYLSNDLVIKSVINPFNKSLYVSPSHMQTRQFSSEKLKPIIDNSPLISKFFQDSSVSQQVFEKGFSNGSFIFLRSAYRSADRCLPEGTPVLMWDGSHKKIELLEVGDKVVAYKNGASSINKVTGKECNGVKPVGRLNLITGHTLKATHNHRFQTDTSLKRLDELSTDDYIPVPFDYLPEGKGGPVDTWMGLMLSDGCMVNGKGSSRCSFNNNDKKLVEYYVELSSQIGLHDLRWNERIQRGKPNYTVSVRHSAEAKNFLDTWGLNGVKYDTKFIPEEFFSNRGRISALLRGYFEGDGWVTWNERTRQCEVGCITASLNVAKGILRGLQSLGIMGIMETWEKGTRSEDQSTAWFTIKIRNVEQIKRYSERVGFINKQGKLDKLLEFAESLLETSARDNDIPARDDCARALKRAGISSHSLWKNHRISFRSNSYTKKLIAVHKVKKIYDITNDEALLKWLKPDVKWVQVKSVTLGVSEERTYDIEVSPDHVFAADGMFTHNTRGVSARNLTLDEIQDMLIDQIPVIRECTSHFKDATTLMAGTPKSLNNPIEIYWKTTSQNEWLVPCEHCRKWNFLDEKNIAPTEWYMSDKLPPGPICRYCGKSIDIKKGRWVSMCPSNLMKGYRVPQLMVPWICGIKSQWIKLLWKRDNYPLSQFYNEVLGLSYDSASSPITVQELIDICGTHSLWDLDRMTSDQINRARGMVLSAGVDWGEGLDGSEKSPSGKIRPASYTVFTIGYYHTQNQFKVVAIKKFTGKEVDPEYVVSFIAKVCKNLGIQLVGVDWGHGWGVNNTLVRLLGGKHVVQFQHLPKLKERMKFDPVGVRYHLSRNFIMSEFFYDMRHGHILFPKWSEFEPYSKDILAIYTEYNEFRREMKYDHRSAEPDDFFHSALYCRLASDIMTGKSRKYTQIREGDEHS